MKALFLICLFAIPVCSQHSHKDDALRGTSNRVGAFEVLYLEPVEEGYRLEAKASDRHEVKYEIFTVTKAASIDEEVRRKPKGKFVFVVWCGDDRFVYLLTAIKPEQIRKN